MLKGPARRRAGQLVAPEPGSGLQLACCASTNNVTIRATETIGLTFV
jgi:hypothetical protein